MDHWMIHAAHFFAGMVVMAAAVIVGRVMARIDAEEPDWAQNQEGAPWSDT